MRIIISPAKKMRVDTDTLEVITSPQFLEQATQIQRTLQQMSREELQSLWRCNDAITKVNVERLQNMDLEKNLTPAILAYEGIQYQYMAPGVFEDGHYSYIGEHLRILSGFYGLVRPFDGVVPYRLEMQAKLQLENKKNLYAFWGKQLAEQLEKETNFILNLASKEYSKSIEPYLSQDTQFVSCTFGEIIDGKIKEKGTMCKMARGQMVRFLAEHNVTMIDGVKSFNQLGYTYSVSDSTDHQLVFLKRQ